MTVLEFFRRGVGIYKDEGAGQLFKQVASYLKNIIYVNEYYYLYEKPLNSYNKLKVAPRINEMVCKIIENIDQYYKMIESGYDFNKLIFESRIIKGGVAFCVFYKKELAHVTWVAFNNKVKKGIDYLPFSVNFENNEVCSGASFTFPEYRGKKLLSYIYSIIFPYLLHKGVRKDKFTININNVSSIAAHLKFNPKTIGKYRYQKILWWKSWSEVR